MKRSALRMAIVALVVSAGFSTAHAQRRRRRSQPETYTTCTAHCTDARNRCIARYGYPHVTCADVGHYCDQDCRRRFPNGGGVLEGTLE